MATIEEVYQVPEEHDGPSFFEKMLKSMLWSFFATASNGRI